MLLIFVMFYVYPFKTYKKSSRMFLEVAIADGSYPCRRKRWFWRRWDISSRPQVKSPKRSPFFSPRRDRSCFIATQSHFNNRAASKVQGWSQTDFQITSGNVHGEMEPHKYIKTLFPFINRPFFFFSSLNKDTTLMQYSWMSPAFSNFGASFVIQCAIIHIKCA